MLDGATAEDLRRHWDQGWNGEDLDTIMAPFAEDVVFSSPFVPTLTGDPAKSTITGYNAVRSYVDYALRHHSGIPVHGGRDIRGHRHSGTRLHLPVLRRHRRARRRLDAP
jgi:hypothetical protein